MPPVFWFLGLSGSGKTTLASMLANHLLEEGWPVECLDGDVFRKARGFAGFGRMDRLRNITAMREEAIKIQAAGSVCIVSAITPYAEMRIKNRRMLVNYREIWVRCALPELKKRDTKGLYALADQGKIQAMTGVSDAFDEPLDAHLVVDTTVDAPGESFKLIKSFVSHHLRNCANVLYEA